MTDEETRDRMAQVYGAASEKMGEASELARRDGGKHVDKAHRTAADAVRLLQEAIPELDAGTSLREKLEGAVVTLTAEYLATPPAPRDWLLMRPDETAREGAAGVFPAGKVGMLAAAGGAGKTAALVRLALAVATGRPWFDGGWFPPKRGRVLLALGEEDADEIKRRVYNTALQMNLDAAQRANAIANITALPLAGIPLPFVQQGQNGNAVEAEGLDAVRAILEKHAGDGWRLLIFDPLSRFASSDAEKDNAQATRLIQAFECLTSVKGGPGVLVAHHTSQQSRKDGDASTSAARGVTALTDGVRWVASLTPRTETPPKDKPDAWQPAWRRTELALTKTNYGPHAEPLYLVNEGGVLRAESDVEETERECAGVESAPRKSSSSKSKGSKPDASAYRDDDAPKAKLSV